MQNKTKEKECIQKHKIKGKTISLRYTHHATVCISLKSILTFHHWIELTFNAMTIKCQRVEVTTNELAINKQLTIAQLVVIHIMCFGDINFHIQTLHHINSLLCLLNILFFFLLTIFIHSIPYIHLFDFISLHNYISLWLWYAPAQHHNHFIAFISFCLSWWWFIDLMNDKQTLCFIRTTILSNQIEMKLKWNKK